MKTELKKAMLLGMAIAFLVSTSIYAEPYYGERKGTGGCGRMGKYDKLTRELGLTPEQETRLKEERERFANENMELTEKMRSKKEELKDNLEKPDMDRAKVDGIIDEIKNLTGEKLKNRVNKISAMKSILTLEQFEKLQQKMGRNKPHDCKYKKFGRSFKCW